MNLFESISVAWEGLVANKMRAALTMLGIVIGVSAVITMLAIAQGAREKMMGQIQSMGTNVLMVFSGQSRTGAVRGGMGSMQSLTLEDAEAIPLKCPSIEKSAPEVQRNAQVKYQDKNTSTQILGTTPDYQSVRNYNVQEGKFFSDSDVKAMRKVAVIGPTTVTNLFPQGVSPVGKLVRIRGVPFTIVGVTTAKGAAGGFGDPDDVLIIPVTTAMRRLFGMQYVRNISVSAHSMDLMDLATEEITTLLRKRHHIAEGAEDDFIIRNQAEVMEMANQAAGIFALLLGGIASVSLLVGGIGIMNIMLVSVTERTREIGIRMALGARRQDIRSQFLIESLVLSLMGGAVGIMLGFIGSWILKATTGWNASVSITSIMLSFGFSAFVGIFFGLYPAQQAARLDPIDALRYE
ncbi:MAG: ABC transporter permease [Armatimonadota bacterium]